MSKTSVVATASAALLLLGSGPCDRDGRDFELVSPVPGELTAAGELEVVLALPLPGAALPPDAPSFALDGVSVQPTSVALRPAVDPLEQVFRFAAVDPGWHRLRVSLERRLGRVRVERRGRRRWGDSDSRFGGSDDSELHDDSERRTRSVSVAFEAVALAHPERCEILNGAECLMPYPSSRFLAADASTPTGLRVDLPAASMPKLVVGSLGNFLNGTRSGLDPAPYARNDGFSPMVQILMHFPGGVDLARSGVAVLDSTDGFFDRRSTTRKHPTVLLEVATGRRIPHFVENDSRASGDRVTTMVRPLESLLPGHRYIMAVKKLRGPDGSLLEAEPVFAALRDRRATSIPEVEARRDDAEEIFRVLRRNRVKRRHLQLAFDFVTQSDEGLTGDMLSMRDQAFAMLEGQEPGEGITPIFVQTLTPPEQCAPGLIWKTAVGTVAVPNFLAQDPDADPLVPADPVADPRRLGFLARDEAGQPLQTGTYGALWGLAVPCDALLDGPLRPLTFGHGLFGNGAFSVASLAAELPAAVDDLKARGLVPDDLRIDFAMAATQWSGLSSPDIVPPPPGIDFGNLGPGDILAVLDFVSSFIGRLFVDFDQFQALPDRLRQGQLATLVLTRHLELGSFNALPAFQAPAGTAIPEGEGVLQTGGVRYFGASLGGIMGLMFSALYPELEASNVDVPAANFGFLVQRAKPFSAFQQVLEVIDDDPMQQLLGLGLLSELWIEGEAGGYLHHITGRTLPPLPGTEPKDLLMTVARYDQQVSTVGAQIAAATLRLPNLPGSVVTDLVGVPDTQRAVRSGHIVYDTGSYRNGTPTEVFIPPAANRPADQEDNRCDPHGVRFTIPASLAQLLRFFDSDAPLENFCNGACDAGEPLELPGGLDLPCDPLAAP